MKLSILLPTRNGAHFLPNCVGAILAEDADLELVVSDNANDDGTPAFLESIDDPRLVVVRHDQPLSVTDNWASAVEASTGDYLLVIGDDDLILPGYARRIEELVEEHNPDCLLYNAYSFVAPGSMPGSDVSQHGDPHFRYGPEFPEYGFINEMLRRDIVRDMFRFKARVPLNMQTTLFSRRAMERVGGPFFPPPFPDHYAINCMLLTSPRWLYVPERLVVVGVSPKSFGHYVYNDDDEAGLAYLGITADFPGRLRGSALLDATYVWLDMLKQAYPDELREVEVSRGDYVLRAAWAWVTAWRAGNLPAAAMRARASGLAARDVVAAARAAFDEELWRKASARLRSGGRESAARWEGLRPLPGVRDIGAFAKWVVNEDLRGQRDR